MVVYVEPKIALLFQPAELDTREQMTVEYFVIPSIGLLRAWGRKRQIKNLQRFLLIDSLDSFAPHKGFDIWMLVQIADFWDHA